MSAVDGVPKPRVGRAGPCDADLVADIYLDARAASDMPPGVHPADEVRRYVRDVVVPQREVWLARTAADAPAGLLVLHGDDVEWLFVAPAAQRRGIGSALIEYAKTLRPGGLTLWVFVANLGARRFYEAHGFVVVGGTDGDNEEGQPDLRLRWAPGPI